MAETNYSADAAGLLQQNYDAITKRIEQEYSLGQQDIAARLQTARIGASASTSNARTAANASMSNAKLAAKVEREKLALAREEMERIGIPDMQIRQFVAEKNYEIARLSFGLDLIKTAVAYNSTADQRFQAADFDQLVRAGVGQGGVLQAPTSRPQGVPTPNNLSDLVAQYGGSGSVFGTPQSVGGGSGGAGSQQPGTLTTQQAAQAVLQANPPSPYAGLNEQDATALRTIGEMYRQGLDFRNVDQMSPTQFAHTISGGKRLGYDTDLELWRMEQSRPGQGSARAA